MSNKGRGLVCMFCGEGFGYEGGTPDEATLKAAVDHEKDCLNNPYKAEIARLTEERDSYGELYATYKREITELHLPRGQRMLSEIAELERKLAQTIDLNQRQIGRIEAANECRERFVNHGDYQFSEWVTKHFNLAESV